MKRVMALGAAVLALGAGAAAFGQKATAGGAAAAQADGGLYVSSGTIEAPAKAGAYGPVTVANHSAADMTVTVSPRKWTQAANGDVSPNRRGGLSGVSVSEPSFTLKAGEQRNLTVNVGSVPSAGSLYGALEVVGLPADVAKRKGLVLGYRVVSAIRLLPATPKTGVSARAIKAAKGTATLPIKNTGNTLDAVSARVDVKTARGTQRVSATLKILPGKTINFSLGKLQKGNASAKITLRQKGKVVVNSTKKFKVK
jgi:hypothetical protein